jgi:hypothetical protein
MRFERWHFITALAAIMLLLFAVSLEAYFESGEDRADFVRTVFSLHSLIIFATELSFALVIALAISMGIERQARARDTQLHEDMRRAIAEDVFKGVFSQSLPLPYVSAVIEKNLKVRAIRTSMKAFERLKEIEECYLPSDNPLRGSLIQVDRVLEYTLENISGRDIVENASFDGPVNHSDLIEHSRITKLIIDGVEVAEVTLRSIKALTDNDTKIRYEWPIHIRKDGTAVVTIESTLFKQRQDSDYWTMYIPTLRFELMMQSDIPLSRAGFLEHTSAQVVSQYVNADKGLISCIIEGPMLPNDSMTYWWSVA